MRSQNRVVHAERGDDSIPQSKPTLNRGPQPEVLIFRAEAAAKRHGTSPLVELVRLLALQSRGAAGEACLQALARGWAHV